VNFHEAAQLLEPCHSVPNHLVTLHVICIFAGRVFTMIMTTSNQVESDEEAATSFEEATTTTTTSNKDGPLPTPTPAWILPVLVFSQFLGTSLWFAPNAVFSKLSSIDHNLTEHDIGYLTSAVQLGFIVGTLVFAMLSIADRLRPTQVFLVCSLLGAVSNLAVIWVNGNGLVDYCYCEVSQDSSWRAFIPWA
jgi:hypothetical protein